MDDLSDYLDALDPSLRREFGLTVAPIIGTRVAPIGTRTPPPPLPSGAIPTIRPEAFLPPPVDGVPSCPTGATYDATQRVCVCAAGTAPNADGSACVAGAGGGVTQAGGTKWLLFAAVAAYVGWKMMR